MSELNYLKQVYDYLLEQAKSIKPDRSRSSYSKDPATIEKTTIYAFCLQLSVVMTATYQEHMNKTSDLLGFEPSILEDLSISEPNWDNYAERDKNTCGHIFHDLKLVAFLPREKLPALITCQETMTEIGNRLLEWRMSH